MIAKTIIVFEPTNPRVVVTTSVNAVYRTLIGKNAISRTFIGTKSIHYILKYYHYCKLCCQNDFWFCNHKPIDCCYDIDKKTIRHALKDYSCCEKCAFEYNMPHNTTSSSHSLLLHYKYALLLLPTTKSIVLDIDFTNHSYIYHTLPQCTH